ERPDGRRDAVFELVRLADEETVRLLAEQLAQVASARTGRQLNSGEHELALVACEALGRMGIRAGAIEALGALIEAESCKDEKSEQRAVEAAIGLCRLGGAEADRRVFAARDRFGRNGSVWLRVRPFVALTGVQEGGVAETAWELLQRA